MINKINLIILIDKIQIWSQGVKVLELPKVKIGKTHATLI